MGNDVVSAKVCRNSKSTWEVVEGCCKWKRGLIIDHITGDDDLIGGAKAVLLDLSKLSTTWHNLWARPKPNMFWPIHEPY
jgi:asparagine synthetase A